MMKADRSTPRGESRRGSNFASREKSKSKPTRDRRTSGDDPCDGERDENGKFKDWPVAGTVFD